MNIVIRSVILAGMMFSCCIAHPVEAQTTRPAIEQSRYNVVADSLLRKANPDTALAWLNRVQSAIMAPASPENFETEALFFAFGRVYEEIRRFEKAADYYQKVLGFYEKNAPQDVENQIIILNALGNSLENFKPQSALPVYEKALELRLAAHGDNSRSAASGYFELAVNYYILSNFENATEYCEKAIRTLKNAGLERDPDYGGYHQTMGLIYHEEGNYPLALAYYQTSLAHLRNTLGAHRETAKCLSTIGELYAKTGDAPHALEFQQQALDMFEQVDKRYLGICFSNMGKAYIAAKQPQKALEYLNKALTFNLPAGRPALPDPPMLYRLSEAYLLAGDYAKALDFIDTAIVQLQPEKEAGMYLWYCLLSKANILSQRYQRENHIEDLKEAAKVMQTAQQTVAGIIAELEGERNKLSVYRDAVTGFGLCIAVFTRLYEASGDVNWLHKAFECSESGKSLLLYQQVLENKSRRRAKVPESLTGQDADLQNQIVNLEKQVFELGSSGATREKDRLREQIFQIKKRQDQIRQQIREDYHDYFRNADAFPEIQTAMVQKALGADEGLLEFFSGDSTIWVFLIRSDTVVFCKTAQKNAVDQYVAQFREAICRYYVTGQKNSDVYLASAQDYTEAALGLYNKLLAPIQQYLPRQLTIVPDAILSYFPFEALLVSRPDRPDRYHQHHYLANDHVIRYAYSAALLREMEAGPNAAERSERLLAMAPFFDGSTAWSDSLLAMRSDPLRFANAPLPYSGEEVYKIAKLTDGAVLVGRNATKSAFMREAPKYRALHLATHAQANDMAGDFSYLTFGNPAGNGDPERLYVSEIYGLQLHAELVALSACETGLGQMYRGEGVVSVARAFAYAGAHSVLQSQWSVSDAQTRSLMELFYQGLKKGLPKDQALYEARRQYLNKFRGEEASPYFWAGFILIGDNKPLSFFSKK